MRDGESYAVTWMNIRLTGNTVHSNGEPAGGLLMRLFLVFPDKGYRIPS